MPLRVLCPECSQQYQLKEELAGKKVRCKMCEAVIPVPAPVVAKPKVQYDEVDFEDDSVGQDDEFDWDDFEREERGSPRAKRSAIAKQKPKKKKSKTRRQSTELASLDESQVTLYGSIGGGLYLLSLVAAAFKVGGDAIIQSLIGFGLMLAFALIAAVILRLAVKLLVGADLPFGSAYLMEIVNGVATGGISSAVLLLLAGVGFDPRANIAITIILFFATVFGIRSHIFGVCILNDIGDPVGFGKGVLIAILEIVIYIGMGIIAGLLVASVGVARFG